MNIQSRSCIMWIILTIVTFGIFGFVWIYQLNKDIESLEGKDEPSGVWPIILTLIFSYFYLIYWSYTRGNSLERCSLGFGYTMKNVGVIAMICAIIGLPLISFALIQNQINNLVENA